MHISIGRDDLLKPLSLAAGVVERRQALPILANVLLRTQQGRLTITGTDLEVEVVTSVAVEGASDGEITVPARKLVDICRALPAGSRVDIKRDKERVVVKSGKSRFTLSTMPAAEFPSIEATQWDNKVAVSEKDLRGVLARTGFCMAQQDVRYYLNGLLLEFRDGRLKAVATDGHRMAVSEIGLAGDWTGERQIIVPRKGVLEMGRFLEDRDEVVELQVGQNHVRVAAKGFVFTSKLIDGRFPDYGKVIPEKQPVRLILGREELKETLARAAILSNEKFRGVRIGLGHGVLKITAHNPEQEEAEEELAVDYAGAEIEIGFNVNYITDAINAIGGDEVAVGLSDSSSSCTIRGPAEASTLYVVMPMRL